MVILFNLVQSIRVLHTIISEAIQAQQQEEVAHFGKSPTSPIFGRSPFSDLQDLLPQPQHNQIHRKRSSGQVGQTNGHRSSHVSTNASLHLHGDHDQADATSTYSAATSSSSNKNPHQQPQRRSSFFGSSSSKEPKPPKDSKKSRSRPTTASILSSLSSNPSSPISPSTPTATTFCLPTQAFGSARRDSQPSTQGQAHIPSKHICHDESKKVPVHGSRPNLTTTAIVDAHSPTSNRKSPHLSLLIPPPNPHTLPSPRSQVRSYPASSPPTAIGRRESPRHLPAEFTAQHRVLLMRLKPLLTVETTLLRRLSLPDDEEEAIEAGGTFAGKAEGHYEVPAKMTTDAARSSPITNNTSRKARSVHEFESGHPNFNLADMRNVAVNATKGLIDFSTPSFTSFFSRSSQYTNHHHNNSQKNVSKTVSVPGRPRARSSVDISGVENRSPASAGTSRTTPSRPLTYFTFSSTTLASSSLSTHPNGSTGGNLGVTSSLGSTVAAHRSISASPVDLEQYDDDARTRIAEPVVPMSELLVRSTTNWKEKLKRWRRYSPGGKIGSPAGGEDADTAGKDPEWNPWDDEEDPARLIQAW